MCVFVCVSLLGEGELVAEGRYTYVGGFKKHKKHGRGKLSSEEDGVSSVYEGDFEDGMRSGTGMYEDSDGNSYEGEFTAGMMISDSTLPVVWSALPMVYHLIHA